VIGWLFDVKSTPSATSSDAPLSAISVGAPPSNAAADTPCTALLGKLPVTLTTSDGDLHSRPALSTWTYVVAWGEPPIVLRCGVPRPAGLVAGAASQLFSVNGEKGVYWLPVRGKSSTVWTTVDRAAYVEVTVPNHYTQPPLGQIADAVAAAMQPVCYVGSDPAFQDRLCTRRP
jgi:hypothetical protein